MAILALKTTSDFKEAGPQLKDVWRSVATMTGEQCVTIVGMIWMLKWLADNYMDYLLQV